MIAMQKETSRPGIGIDAMGGQVIDPTKNVEDLVKAGEQRAADLRDADRRFLDAQLVSMEKQQNFAREADAKFQSYAREAGEKLEESLRYAESIRVNELAATRKEYENTIRDMLAKSVETTSTLVSTQLVQIQATFDKRVSQLEAYQFTQAGRSSVADPALSNALDQLANGQKASRSNLDDAMARMTAALETIKITQGGFSANREGQRGVQDDFRNNLSVWISLAALAVVVFFHFFKG